MKKRLTGIVLALEIAAIVILHVIKLNHQDKARISRQDDESQQQTIGLSHSYSFFEKK